MKAFLKTLGSLVLLSCFAVPAMAIGPQTLDPTIETGSGGGAPCPPATNQKSCEDNCNCVFTKNKNKCGANPLCVNIALSEQHACLGKCLTDY